MARINEVETMIRIGCIFAALLTCSACSAPTPSATPAVPATSAPALPAAAPEARKEVWNLKFRYVDKAAFLADVQANRPIQAVSLDDDSVWEGFGPAVRYHTNQDGSISR